MTSADELVDVIDDEGRTVAVVPRRQIRARRLPHRCTYVLVFDARGRLFVHLRTASKDVFPSHHDVAIGGVVAAGETFHEGARREIREELGVEAEPEELFPFRYSDPHTIVQAMVYELRHEGPFQLQADEIVCGEFVEREKLREMITREKFCPDGLEVFAQYQKQCEADGPAVRS